MSELTPIAEPLSEYHFPVVDRFTPSCDQAGPLDTHLANPRWGTTPLDYVSWFDGLWHGGDPSQWGPEVFTSDAVMIDPTGTSIGAGPAASDFLLLFQHFPDLRGEVVSWSANDIEVMINWRFVVAKGRVCPVVDKFSFVHGLVSFRQAYFDTMMLLSYLAENFGSAPLTDYFIDRFWRTTSGGFGVLFVPSLIKAIATGLFHWPHIPPPPPEHVTATHDGSAIRLQWEPVEGAKSYTVKRATNAEGPYTWIAPYHLGTSYEDRGVQPGVKYHYVVCSNRTSTQLLPPVKRLRRLPGRKAAEQGGRA